MSIIKETECEQGLLGLSDSNDSISSFSLWCLGNAKYHDKIVEIWWREFQKVNAEQKVRFFYLVNDIIQHNNWKVKPYISTFKPVLKTAAMMVEGSNLKRKILRIFEKWGELDIYDDKFLTDLVSVLTSDQQNVNVIDLEKSSKVLDEIAIPSDTKQVLETITNQPASENAIVEMENVVKKINDSLTIPNQQNVNVIDLEKSSKVLDEIAIPSDTKQVLETITNQPASENAIVEMENVVKKINDSITAQESYLKEMVRLNNLLEVREQYDKHVFRSVINVMNACKCLINTVQSNKKRLHDQIDTFPSTLTKQSLSEPCPEPGPSGEGALHAGGGLTSNNHAAVGFVHKYKYMPTHSKRTRTVDSDNNTDMDATNDFNLVTTQSQVPAVYMPPNLNYNTPIPQVPHGFPSTLGTMPADIRARIDPRTMAGAVQQNWNFTPFPGNNIQPSTSYPIIARQQNFNTVFRANQMPTMSSRNTEISPNHITDINRYIGQPLFYYPNRPAN